MAVRIFGDSRAASRRQGGGNLPYFLDSNVFIGYYFHVADTWEPRPRTSSTTWSRTIPAQGVRAECFGDGTGGRCYTIQQNLVREFRRVVAHLKRDGSADTLLVEAVTPG